MTIIARKDGKKFKNMEETDFDLEENIQELILDDQIMKKINLDFTEDKTLVTLSREFESGNGRIDVLAVDADGHIYIIEAKLHRNSEGRRHIFAQIIDYAGGMWAKFSGDSGFVEFENQLLEHNSKSKDNLILSGKSLSEIILDSTLGLGADIANSDNIIRLMKENFISGEFKFVLVFDELDEQLKNTINYINEKSSMTIYAVTYEYYTDNNLEILIPSVYGRAAEQRSTKKSSGRIPWTLEQTKQNFKDKLSASEHKMFLKLYQFLDENKNMMKIGNGVNGSIGPVFDKLCRPELRGSFLTLDVGGGMKINYPWLKLELRKKIAESFSNNPELKMDSKSILLSDLDLDHTYPTYSRDQWSNNVDSIIETIKKFI